MIECDTCGTLFTPFADNTTGECPDCGTENYPDDDPDYEPPNCYIPGYGWTVI